MEQGRMQQSPLLIVSLLIALALLLVLASPILSLIKSKTPAAQPAKKEISQLPFANVSREEELPQIIRHILTPPKSAKELADDAFLESSYLINQRFTTVFFETRLIRVGFFSIIDEATRAPRDVFRADFYLKNIQSDPHNFYVDEGSVWYNLDNYSSTYNNFTSNSVEPGEERYAYVLFGAVPRSLSGPVTITVGTTRAFSPIFSDIIVVPYGFNVSLPLLARPRSVLG